MAELQLGGILLYKGAKHNIKFMPGIWFSMLSQLVSFLFSSPPSFWREWKPQICFTVVCCLARSPSCLDCVGKPVKEQKSHYMVLMTDRGTSVMNLKCSGILTDKKLPGWIVFSASICRAIFAWQISSYISHHFPVGYPQSGKRAKFKE